MRIVASVLFISSTYLSFGQSFAEANTHFDRYEYAETIKVLEALENNDRFELDQLKQLGYSYYAIGNFEKALPIIDSILKIKPIEPYFYYMQGEASFAIGNTEKAIAGFRQYTEKDGSIDVSLRIASAELLPTWSSMEIDTVEAAPISSEKAVVLGSTVQNGNFVYKEVGVNKIGEFLTPEEDINSAELLLMRPFLYTTDLSPVEVVGGEKYWSIHDICIEPTTNRAKVSISSPLATKESDQGMKLYEAIFDEESKRIEILKPWVPAGLENVNSIGFATYNESGTMIVFCVSSSNTNGVDLYSMKKGSDSFWTSPIALSELNTSADDLYPRFFGDSLLSFSSNGRLGFGGLDLYQVKLNGLEIDDSKISHLPAPLNSFSDDFNIQFDGDSLVRVTSNRWTPSTSDDNIFRIYLPVIEDSIIQPPIVDLASEFIVSWGIKYIYFNFDNFDIFRDSPEVDFERIKVFLKANPNCKIKLTGKTDNRGSEEYNLILGLKRAESVKEELVLFGISEKQIFTVSKGMSEPIVDCPNSLDCSDEEHAKNRVVTLELIYEDLE